jgi:myo-inositol-1(or 4)-monophosphatase
LSEDFTTAAAEAVLRAGAIQRERYGSDLRIEHKGAIDLVTEVDHASEAAILEVLQGRFPDHDIVTEEQDLERRGSRHVWYVDPLDGTTNFAHGFPFFCSVVALAVDGQVVAGAIYDPLREELFTGERGAGAHLNGRRLRVSRAPDLLSALLITGFAYDVHQQLEHRIRLFKRFLGVARGIRRSGSAGLDLCCVAAGRADGFFEERLNPWDVLAGGLFVEEAGGRLSRFDGTHPELRADEVLASNRLVHDAMLEIVRD